MPGILNQLGPDSLNQLRKLAESYQAMQKKEQEASAAGTAGAGGDKKKGAAEDDEDEDDDIPDLVEGTTFDSKVE